MPRNRRSARSISPVVGTLILVAITVVLAATAAVFALGFQDSTDSTAPTVRVEATFNATDRTDPHWTFSLTHESGDDIEADELEFELTGDLGGTASVVYPERFTAGTRVRIGLWGSPGRANPDTCLVAPKASPGAGNNQLDGNSDDEEDTSVDIRVVHRPSNTVLDQVTVTLAELDRGFTGQQRHYIADGARASVNCDSVPRDDW